METQSENVVSEVYYWHGMNSYCNGYCSIVLYAIYRKQISFVGERHLTL